MTTARVEPKDFRPARKRTDVTVGESVRILRELQELSQNRLAELTGIPQSTISAIERDRVNLEVERAKVLARGARQRLRRDPQGAARCGARVRTSPALADQVYLAAKQMHKRGQRTVVELPKRG